MKFLCIYTVFSILTFIVLKMQAYISSREIEREFPELTALYYEKYKTGALEKIFLNIKTFIACFIPIMNIALFYTSLFETEEVKKHVLNKAKEKLKNTNCL